METLICKCSQCNTKLGRFVNLWTQVGKSYVTPIVAPDESRTISTKGPTRVGDQNTLVSGWYISPWLQFPWDTMLRIYTTANYKTSLAPIVTRSWG